VTGRETDQGARSAALTALMTMASSGPLRRWRDRPRCAKSRNRERIRLRDWWA